MATEETIIEQQQAETHENGAENWEGGASPFRVSYGKLMMWYFLLSDAFTFAGFLIAYGALRFSSPTWPVPDFVFNTAPLGLHEFFPNGQAPLIFVTFMSFLLIISSVTMVRAVQEGHRENQKGVAFWLLMTILGGAGFLACQAWEWTNLIAEEHMSLNTDPFGTWTQDGVYLEDEHGHAYEAGAEKETFEAGESYLIHQHEGEWIQRQVQFADGSTGQMEFGPKAFGALFFSITGFHGFHVTTGVVILLIILVNTLSGLYVKRKNGYEMVEKVGLYWHFVDLVWVFVFLVFYLL
jgi:cytochrome c oxidase subunit 3